ncbi:MAG: hypothetical protein RMK19_06520, partial [Bacteroidia bacterium]|nr:hypothetical protein [Bacteroidia bacterium]MDW8015648.1 hypothetical protein [Bacteroidia bacterium]
MRPLLVLLLLLLIGAAAWLLWEKLGHLRPPKAPETQSPTLSYQEEVEGEMTTIVDTSPKLSSPPTSSLQKLS